MPRGKTDETNLDFANCFTVPHPQGPPWFALCIRMESDIILLDDQDLEPLDEASPHTLALRRGVETLLQDGVPVTEQPTSATDPRVFTVVWKPDHRHGGLVVGEDPLDLVFIDVVERCEERFADLELDLAERTLEEHLV